MFHRIKNNLPQLIATFSLAVIAYLAVGMLIPTSDEAAVSLGDLTSSQRNESLASSPAAVQQLAPSAAAAAPPHQFTEQEKAVFASLPPMCRPPGDFATPQFPFAASNACCRNGWLESSTASGLRDREFAEPATCGAITSFSSESRLVGSIGCRFRTSAK